MGPKYVVYIIQPWKKGTRGIFDMKMHRRKVLSMKTFKTWSHCPKTKEFFLDFNSCDIIFWDPILFWGGKSPRNLKLRTLFPVIFFQRTSKNWDFFTKVFISSFFPQKLVFLWLSYIDSIISDPPYKDDNARIAPVSFTVTVSFTSISVSFTSISDQDSGIHKLEHCLFSFVVSLKKFLTHFLFVRNNE